MSEVKAFILGLPYRCGERGTGSLEADSSPVFRLL
jgi:hypothetical protein